MKADELLTIFGKPADGSLPEINITLTSSSNRQLVVNHVISKLRPDLYSQTVWDCKSGKDVSCSRLKSSDLAELLTDGSHIILRNSLNIPDLGMGVFNNSISFDFKTGSHWSKSNLQCLLDLLEDIRNLDPDAAISLDEEEEFFTTEERRKFTDVFKKWADR